MSVLSNVDIMNELGNNIYVHPLILDNIRGNTINLTASEMAWSLTNKKSIVKKNNGRKVIEIPAHDTVLIETEESVYVSSNIGGTYHSRVSMVSSGLGHIGTTLDPSWIGPSLIAIHNHLDDTVTIDVGDSIASIIFHYLNTESTYKNTNGPGQTKVLLKHNIILSNAESKNLNEEWHSNPDKLREKMINSEAYTVIKKMREEAENLRRDSFAYRSWSFIKSYITPIIGYAVIALGIYFIERNFLEGNHKVSTWLINIGSSGVVVAILLEFCNDNYRRMKAK